MKFGFGHTVLALFLARNLNCAVPKVQEDILMVKLAKTMFLCGKMWWNLGMEHDFGMTRRRGHYVLARAVAGMPPSRKLVSKSRVPCGFDVFYAW